jgi:hypothetical protein
MAKKTDVQRSLTFQLFEDEIQPIAPLVLYNLKKGKKQVFSRELALDEEYQLNPSLWDTLEEECDQEPQKTTSERQISQVPDTSEFERKISFRFFEDKDSPDLYRVFYRLKGSKGDLCLTYCTRHKEFRECPITWKQMETVYHQEYAS